ncbi:uncharacterized protein LOC141899354 [Tubulanus polymorphus]|uniref:uncharacterized protein LOC141899354 n=1 Tax=Tubulanus polymorphus TaxID=672921 RepID=UPI003DA22F9D
MLFLEITESQVVACIRNHTELLDQIVIDVDEETWMRWQFQRNQSLTVEQSSTAAEEVNDVPRKSMNIYNEPQNSRAENYDCAGNDELMVNAKNNRLETENNLNHDDGRYESQYDEDSYDEHSSLLQDMTAVSGDLHRIAASTSGLVKQEPFDISSQEYSINQAQICSQLRSTKNKKKCSSTRGSSAKMTRHVGALPKSTGAVSISQCSTSYQLLPTTDGRSSHQKHSPNRPFKCQYCQKMFRYPWHLKEHVITHSTVKPFTCVVCTRSFTRKRLLRYHIEKTHPERQDLIDSLRNPAFDRIGPLNATYFKDNSQLQDLNLTFNPP